MTVASRAVAMAVMTEARAVDVEQEGDTSRWVEFDTAGKGRPHFVKITIHF